MTPVIPSWFLLQLHFGVKTRLLCRCLMAAALGACFRILRILDDAGMS